MALRIALVAGPMYDHLYRAFDDHGIDVEIVIHADHPTLNRRAAEMLAAGERIDVLATHSKYAPAQSRWLQPLDGLIGATSVERLAPRAVELCRFDGTAFCLPRLIDVRVLWARADRVPEVPDTWASLAASEVVFGFPGRESGLFGTFFELVVAHGGRLFDDDHCPCIDSPEARAAVELLCTLARRAPGDLADWHYDGVDRALLAGRVDVAAAWPGGWGAIAARGLPLLPHLYPAGPDRRVSYSGCHAWAIPNSCGDLDGAIAALEVLLGFEAQLRDAAGGNMCAHVDALASVQPSSDVDARRLEITRRTIDEAMITYPSLVRFPEIEDAGWGAIQDALLGRTTAADAVASIQAAALRISPQHTDSVVRESRQELMMTQENV